MWLVTSPGSILVTLLLTTVLLVPSEGRKSLIDSAIGNEDGYLATCSINILDMAITPYSTDSLRILLIDGKVDRYHVFNISRASDLLTDPIFKVKQRTVVLAHGFASVGYRAKNRIVEVYLAKKGYNILVFDAFSLIKNDYLVAVRQVRYIGRRFGIILSQLVHEGLNTTTLEVVGHSLGAQIVGHVGKTFRKQSGKSLRTVIGLDPSGPCFRKIKPAERLDRSDADFVQIIHTDSTGYGIRAPIGHVDFYVNGGGKQTLEGVLPCGHYCSHLVVVDYWAQALKHPRSFVANECASLEEAEAAWCRGPDRKTALMGPALDRKSRGIYYVKTAPKKPFSMGMKGAVIINPSLKKP